MKDAFLTKLNDLGIIIEELKGMADTSEYGATYKKVLARMAEDLDFLESSRQLECAVLENPAIADKMIE